MLKKTIIEKLHEYDTNNKVYCKCGCGVVFYNTGRDRLICPNCKHFIYKNKEIEFKYKMKGMLNK